MADKPCSNCGNVHEYPFSPEVMDQYLSFTHAATAEKRTVAAMQLAESFYDNHDLTDMNASEGYHDFFEKYEQARLDYQQASLKLSRLAVRIIEEYHKQHDFPVDVTTESHGVVN